MRLIEGKHLYLTQSFRFGHLIAEEANVVLQKSGAQIMIKGNPNVDSKIQDVDVNRPYTFISRGNAGIFEEILMLSDKNKKVAFVGNIDQVMTLFESAYFLFKNKPSRIKDYGLKRFQDWGTFKSEAIQNQDQDYLGVVKFIETYQKKMSAVLEKIKNTCSFAEDEADVIVTTAHKAKGRQWDQVRLNNDFNSNTQEELNVFYVAMTRAVLVLDLSKIIEEK
jgi:hypothetical protein